MRHPMRHPMKLPTHAPTRRAAAGRLLVLALLAGNLLHAPAARAADLAGLAQAQRALHAGVTHGKADEIRRARAAFAALIADDPGSPELQYWLALCDWRVVPLLTTAEPGEARRLCKEGIAACDRAAAGNPKLADAVALKASLQGLAIGFVPSSAMALSAEIEEGLGRAAGIAPGNPRVELFAGINALHKPVHVGGGAERARPHFVRALALFEKAPPADSTAIAWGREDALLWQGQCLAALGDWAGAIEQYHRALELEPDHAWVKRVLLPRAEQMLAEAKAKP